MELMSDEYTYGTGSQSRERFREDGGTYAVRYLYTHTL
jgi:hypothetical protein